MKIEDTEEIHKLKEIVEELCEKLDLRYIVEEGYLSQNVKIKRKI